MAIADSDFISAAIREIADKAAVFADILIGIHKPHLPWGLPQRFWDLYPDETALPIAKHPDVPVNMPPIAYHFCDWAHFPHNATHGHPVSTAVAQHARHGYYAAVSFTDSLVCVPECVPECLLPPGMPS